MGKAVGNTNLQHLPIGPCVSRSSRSCESHFTSDQNRGKAICRFPPIPFHILTSLCLGKKENRSFNVMPCMIRGVLRAYTPGSVGCCTIGFGGLVESVLVVVVEAAPSSRDKAMIHVIMGVSSCFALPFPRIVQEVGTKKSQRDAVG
jgi:hypothetical protein